MTRGIPADGEFLCDEATVFGAAITERSYTSVRLCIISYELAAVPFVKMT